MGLFLLRHNAFFELPPALAGGIRLNRKRL